MKVFKKGSLSCSWEILSEIGMGVVNVITIEYSSIIFRRTHTDTTRLPWTKIVQGDLDTTGKIFDRAVAAIKANETEYIYKKFNSEEHSFGSHIK